jgi:hypothetical protein
VVDALPEMLVSGSNRVARDNCSQVQPFLTQVKFIGTYQLPWALSVAATYQNSYNTTATAPNINPGAPRMGISATYVASNAQVVPSLGRTLSAGANANVNVNVVEPGTMWGSRLQQVDLRFGRTFKVGRGSFKAMVDLYNALNANDEVAYNNTYGTNGATWLSPLAILPGRLVKLGIQINY